MSKDVIREVPGILSYQNQDCGIEIYLIADDNGDTYIIRRDNFPQESEYFEIGNLDKLIEFNKFCNRVVKAEIKAKKEDDEEKVSN